MAITYEELRAEIYRETGIGWGPDSGVYVTSSRATGNISFGFAAAAITETDLLERELAPVAVESTGENGARLRMRAFQIVTLRVRRADRHTAEMA